MIANLITIITVNKGGSPVPPPPTDLIWNLVNVNWELEETNWEG